MRYNPAIHHRRSIRLRAFDYTQAGAYFVTICTHNRELTLTDRLVREIVINAWIELPRRFPRVRLDEFVVMPNHVHGILWITWDHLVGAQLDGSATGRATDDIHSQAGRHLGKHHAAPLRTDVVQPGSLGAIVRALKSKSAKRINRLRVKPGSPVWQRNYYEHIIRDEEDLTRIRQYIADNPAKWDEDADNPANWRDADHRRGAA